MAVEKTFVDYGWCSINRVWNADTEQCEITLYDNSMRYLPNRCRTYDKFVGCTDASRINLTENVYNELMGLTAVFIFSVFSFTLLNSLSNILRKN